MFISAGSPSVDNQLVAVVVRETTGPSPDELRSHHVASDDVTVRPTVHVVPGDWDIKGAWTLLPLFPRYFFFFYFYNYRPPFPALHSSNGDDAL